MEPKRRLIRSIFSKLLAVTVLAGICINIVPPIFFNIYGFGPIPPLGKNILHHLNYIMDDLGNPPRLDRAKEIVASASSLQIAYEGPNLSWSTVAGIPDFQEVKWQQWEQTPQTQFGKYHNRYFIAVTRDQGRFVFELEFPSNPAPFEKRLIVIQLAVSTLVLTIAFLAIRRILRPVRWLNQGVYEVSRGNLIHKVPLKKSDELRDLSEAFNDMTGRIRDMLHTKEQLMRDVSHELRSPITRIRVALEFLPDGETKESIRNDIIEMGTMIKAILETARIHHRHSKLNLQRTNLSILLAEVLPEFEAQLPGLHTKDFPTQQTVFVDPDQIKTVFKNIMTNAIKYSNPASAPVHISLKDQPPYIVVQIADNGIGIPQDEMPFIFEPFYRVDKSRSRGTGGFGLGLSLCKTIMDAHNGKIEIESTLNVGTTVRLFFPDKNGQE